MEIKLYCTYHFSNYCSWLTSYEDFIVTLIDTQIKLIDLSEENLDDVKEITVGNIQAYRINLQVDPQTLLLVMDSFSKELLELGNYFLSGDSSDAAARLELLSWSDYLYHIPEMAINPEYRGHNIGLKAVGLFLEGFAKDSLVSCHPEPNEVPSVRSIEKQKVLLKQYWSKLGLTHYDEQLNLLWEPAWQLPDWLSDTLWS